MSGVAHSIILGLSDVRYQRLDRSDVDVEITLIPSPPKGYLRVATPFLVEAAGIFVKNSSAAGADGRVILDTPRGSFVIDDFSLAPGDSEEIGVIGPFEEGESIRIVLLAVSGAGAFVEVSARWSDIDTIFKKTVEIGDDWTTVFEGSEGVVYPFIGLAVEVNPGPGPGPDLDLEMRTLLADGTPIIFGFAPGFPNGYVTFIDSVFPTLREGQKFQFRRTSATGNGSVYIFNRAPDNYR